jgi:hypothetical protein
LLVAHGTFFNPEKFGDLSGRWFEFKSGRDRAGLADLQGRSGADEIGDCGENEDMKTQHAHLMEDSEFRRLLAIEALVAEASEAIASLMAEQNVGKADLARRLNKSRAWMTQLLSGKANMTVRTLAEVVYAPGAEVKLQAQPPSWTMCGRLPDVDHTGEASSSSRGRWSYEQPPPIAQATRLTA